ncbi:MAG: retroviral-like aspartic protease family protein [Verrucomicrobia bacterium]|nr:retroviral-like aspartic protease family protein [Verrucomicrobiota bacterium]
MKRLLLALVLFTLPAMAAVDLNRELPQLALKDGRVLSRVRIVRYSEQVVMARWDGGAGTLAYANLPDPVIAAIEQAHLRPVPKPPPAAPKPPPAPAIALASDLPSGTKLDLVGRRQGSQLFLQVTVAAGGRSFPCECLLDTGASMTTVNQAQVPLPPAGHREFSTANGQVQIPYARANVTVGTVTKEVAVALAPSLRVNLLGADFFEDFVYTIDLQGATIHLVKR